MDNSDQTNSPFADPSVPSAILELSNFDPPGFVAAVTATLANPAAMLNVPSGYLLAFAPPVTIARFLDMKYPKESTTFDAMGGVMSNYGNGAGLAGVVVKHWFKTYKHAKQRGPAGNYLNHFTVSRPVVTFADKERRMMQAMAQLAARGILGAQQWSLFVAMLGWNGGTCLVAPTPEFAPNPRATEIRNLLLELLRGVLPDQGTFIGETAAIVARYPEVQPVVSAAFDDARWMTPQDLAASPILTGHDKPGALLLGYHPESGGPVLYDGHESMITIGGPGSGKSQAHVIPNLLTYPGSAIVLDVKGELWEATAGHRMRYGPVYRFAPTDPSGRTHRYNPFDFISRDPDQAAVDCSVFSFQVIAENPRLTDPFWEGKGRDFVWALAMLVAMRADPTVRNLEALNGLFGLEIPPARPEEPFSFDDDDEEREPVSGEAFLRLIHALKILGHQTGIPDLTSNANAMLGSMGNQRLESIIDTARRHLSVFGRAGFTRTALSASDWSPQQLRSKEGTTVYICIPPGELKAFAPIVRLMLTQHSRILQRHTARPDELPITFFLDEMPQLGNFESILEVQDVGRGAGLRLWMFAQSLGQLSQAFGSNRYAGIVNTCRVRSFMQPDTESARFIEPNLGQTHNMFTNEKKPLAAPNELMGRAFIDKTIVTVRGDYPLALDRRMAWQTMADRLNLPPPVVHPAVRP